MCVFVFIFYVSRLIKRTTIIQRHKKFCRIVKHAFCRLRPLKHFTTIIKMERNSCIPANINIKSWSSSGSVLNLLDILLLNQTFFVFICSLLHISTCKMSMCLVLSHKNKKRPKISKFIFIIWNKTYQLYL